MVRVRARVRVRIGLGLGRGLGLACRSSSCRAGRSLRPAAVCRQLLVLPHSLLPRLGSWLG